MYGIPCSSLQWLKIHRNQVTVLVDRSSPFACRCDPNVGNSEAVLRKEKQELQCVIGFARKVGWEPGQVIHITINLKALVTKNVQFQFNRSIEINYF